MRRVIDYVDSLVEASQQPAVDVEYAKRHIRSLSDREDELVLGWIGAAASYFSEQTGRPTTTETRELWLDRFPDGAGLPVSSSDGTVSLTGSRIQLPHPPLQSVVSVEYIDGTGALVPFSDGASPETVSYAVKAPAGPYAVRGWIEPLYGLSWPTARAESGSVRIRYRCGYGDSPDDVPALVRNILCFLVGHFDQNRVPVAEGKGLEEIPYGVLEMLRAFKYSALPTMVIR